MLSGEKNDILSGPRAQVEELAAPLLAALHTQHRTLWARVKAHEANPSSADEEALSEVIALIHAMNEELDVLDVGRTLVRLREIAIAENEAAETRR